MGICEFEKYVFKILEIYENTVLFMASVLKTEWTQLNIVSYKTEKGKIHRNQKKLAIKT